MRHGCAFCEIIPKMKIQILNIETATIVIKQTLMYLYGMCEHYFSNVCQVTTNNVSKMFYRQCN